MLPKLAIAKSREGFPAGAVIVNDTAEVCCSDALVPVIVSGYVAGATLLVVAIVKVAVPLLGMVDKSKLPVAPGGIPVTVKSTFPLKPFAGATLTATAVLPPTLTVAVDAEVASAKSGDGAEATGTV